MKRIFLVVLLIFTCIGVDAKKKVFYGSKSDIIGISGQVDALIPGDYSGKFFKNDVNLGLENLPINEKGCIDGAAVCAELNNKQAGQAILKYILNDGNGYISFDRLDARSKQNVSSAELEVAEADVTQDVETTLVDNVAPQFAKNYIYYQAPYKDKEKHSWVILHAMMDESTFQQVFNILSENNGKAPLSALDVVNVPIELVEEGISKNDDEEVVGKSLRDIGKTVADFAIRGQVSRNSATFGEHLVSTIGSNNGLKENDMMYFYRQKLSKDGEYVSAPLGAARVVDITGEEARLLSVSGGWASEKKGDVAVLRQDHKQSSNIMLDYQNKSIGINYQHEMLLKMSKCGLSHNLLIRAGVSYLLPSENKLKDKAGYVDEPDHIDGTMVYTDYVPYGTYYYTDQYGDSYIRYFDNFKKPLFIHIGVGYSPSWHFAHMLELMPYVMAEIEMLYGINNKTFDLKSDDKNLPTYTSASIRGKGGVKVNFNLDKLNRFQLFVGAEYNFLNYKFNKYEATEGADSNKKVEIYPYNWWNDGVAKANHVRRTGLDFYLGFRINY